jgi:exonuclease III
MLREFLRSQDIDIVFLHEVTNHALQDLEGYNIYLNVGTEMRGTAIVTKQDLQITNINKLPFGRGMTADFRGVKLINKYAPSGTAKNEKESKYIAVK